MSAVVTQQVKPQEITNHDEILAAIRSVEILSDLLEQHDGHFHYELDLEVTVYGRNYGGKKVGPYARLLVYPPGAELIKQGSWGGNTFYVLVEGKLEAFLDDEAGGTARKVGEVPPGRSVGEMAVLAGVARSATVKVSPEAPAKVLEVTRPALRLFRKMPKFGPFMDRTYRNYGLNLMLDQVKRLPNSPFTPEMLQSLGDAARFTVYGKNHVMFREGDPINRIAFIKGGWVRRTTGVDFNEAMADMLLGTKEGVGVDFLGAGNCLGLEALRDGAKNWNYTGTVMTRVEVLEVSVPALRSDPQLAQAVVGIFSGLAKTDDEAKPTPPEDKRTVSATAKEISTGVIDGTNLLVMDMDLCVRCGNCSLACHKMHGHSRLLRHGIHIERPIKPTSANTQHVLIPQVCMHCQDPECLTGCPTGAISRFPGGQIDITNKLCIGCGDCATQCPYNAISMIPRKPEKTEPPTVADKVKGWLSLGRAPLPAPVTAVENLLAVKCNLCEGTSLNPPGSKSETHAYSCEINCPTGALVRVNPREYFDEAKDAIGFVYRDQTHAIGRDIHKSDPLYTAWNVGGILATILITVATIYAALKFTLDRALMEGSWLTVRWVTGLVGLAGIVIVMLYPGRKQIYKKRAGALRYWLQSHAYVGLIAGTVLLVHGGRKSGGLLTSALMLSFDLVIATGIFGVLCYFIVPRIMTSIEGDPLLIEDLRARQRELRETLAEVARSAESNPKLQEVIRTKVRSRFLSFNFLLRQYVKREDLKTLLANARTKFRPLAETMRDAQGNLDKRAEALLTEAVEATATLRRVDALVYCHQVLKLWLAPHVVSTALMLALMLVHIVQVVYFNVR